MNRKSVLYLADTKEEKTKEMTKWCNGTNLLISGSVLVVSKSPTELFSSRFTFWTSFCKQDYTIAGLQVILLHYRQIGNLLRFFCKSARCLFSSSPSLRPSPLLSTAEGGSFGSLKRRADPSLIKLLRFNLPCIWEEERKKKRKKEAAIVKETNQREIKTIKEVSLR